MATKTSPPNRLTPPSVVGLEGSRKLAGQRHRRKRIKARITSSVTIAILAGVVLSVAYVGYTIYTEQRSDELVEHDRRQAEIQIERQGQTADDIIVELEETPRWNGPGAPAFGVGGDADTTPDPDTGG